MFAFGIFKVIYAPHKAFKEIIENPKYFGPLLILILFVAANMGSQYVRSTKIYLQQTAPSSLDAAIPDPWTEDYSLWESNTNITSITQDGTFGYNSVHFSITNDVMISMTLQNIGSINCTGPSGYRNVTFDIKWINPIVDTPPNASLYLYSTSVTDYFYHNITEFPSQSSNGTWSNFTIPVGPSSMQWTNSSVYADWSNITSLKIELVWPEAARSNLTVLIDRLFFQSDNYEPLADLFGTYAATLVFNAVTGFLFNWMLLSIMLLIVARINHFKAEFRIFLIIMGYALVVMFVMQILLGIFYLWIPTLYAYVDTIVPTDIFQTAVKFSTYVTLLSPIWSIIITALGIAAASKLPMSKSTTIAVFAFLPYYLLLFIV